MNLTEQEHVVLSICVEGEDILAIGNWKEPVERLFERGLLRQRGESFVITESGRRAFQQIEAAEIDEGFLTIEDSAGDA